MTARLSSCKGPAASFDRESYDVYPEQLSLSLKGQLMASISTLGGMRWTCSIDNDLSQIWSACWQRFTARSMKG